ncbi:MAG: hypothetical protein KAQ69_06940 [Spirochaetales bacterium]|nr:hypothetical protein [Spirochaetales bacterium]
MTISKLVDEGLLIRKRAHGISIVNDASKIISETTNGLSFTEAVIKQGFKILKAEVQKTP